MKKAIVFKLSLLLVSALCLSHSFAQDSPQWGLPEDAKARFGKGIINEIQYSPDGTRLAVVSSIGIWLYDAMTYQEVALITGHTYYVKSVVFSPDGSTLAGGSGSTTVLWDTDTGFHKRTYLPLRAGWVESVVFSPDGRTIASGFAWDNTIRLWDAAPGENLQTLTGHTDWVYSVAFSPDGSTPRERE